MADEGRNRMIEPPPDNTEPTDALYEWLSGKRTFSALVARSPLLTYLWDAIKKADNLPLHLTWMFTAILAIFAIFAWKDAKETAKTLQDQLRELRNEQRPWLYSTEATIDGPIENTFINDTPAVVINVNFKVKNVGKRPANDVDVIASLNYTDADQVLAGKIDSGGCDTPASIGEHTSSNYTFFPAEEKIVEGHYSLDEQSTRSWKAGVRPKEEEEAKSLYLVGCIVYRTGDADDDFVQTNFVYRLKRSGRPFPPSGYAFPTANIDTKNVKLEPQAADFFSTAK